MHCRLPAVLYVHGTSRLAIGPDWDLKRKERPGGSAIERMLYTVNFKVAISKYMCTLHTFISNSSSHFYLPCTHTAHSTQAGFVCAAALFLFQSLCSMATKGHRSPVALPAFSLAQIRTAGVLSQVQLWSAQDQDRQPCCHSRNPTGIGIKT